MPMASTGRFDVLHERLGRNNVDLLESSPNDGNTALHWLMKSTSYPFELQEKILNEYLSGNPQRCSPANLNRETPLHTAISSGRISTADMLIRNGADLTRRDDSERTPLDLAKELDRTDFIAILEKAVESADAQDG
ncbi:hypothetical protein D6C77_05082 [Aureobasidium pullulans]|uniref:Ankyrin n=1 Tax=Aureobasidium pullulans TaxID=5580 RepID=A0AB74IXG3_AURPU|nr:hypothetical protein D6D21_05183 [Aureobasidium pullulans]TIA59058.1 hypothetical protein D6C77_05082 [Aureobasidium pullulans]